MQYLVLRRFRSIGKTLNKGDAVDETMIRSPRLRQSEGKIIPAVPSFYVPEEVPSVEEPLQDTKTEDTITGEPEQPAVPEKKLFSLKHAE